MSRILLRGGRIIDPRQSVYQVGDVFLDSGRVGAVELQARREFADTRVIDCNGWWVIPGLVDPHVHLRDPGFPAKETIPSGLRAAAAGGFTTVAAMANTAPVNDSPETAAYMLTRALEAHGTRLLPVSAVTRGLGGRELVDIRAMAQAGARMFSDDGLPIDDALVLQRALASVASEGYVVSLHEEDRALTDGGAMNAGRHADALGVKGIPNSAETLRVQRDLALARAIGAPVHIAHISTAESLDMVRAARAEGLQVSCEATPHHFTLDDSAVVEFGPDARMAPPLRTAIDREAIRAGLADGTIDMVATDHAPHDPTSKKMSILASCFPHRSGSRLPPHAADALAAAANGIIGLETALGLTCMLVHQGLISPTHMVELMALNPARLLRLDKAGTLAPGAVADVTVVDPNFEWTVNPTRFRSLSRNTPFTGMKLKGKTMLTLVDGITVFDGRNAGTC